MLVFIYEYHDCNKHRAVRSNQLPDMNWQICAGCKRMPEINFKRFVRYLDRFYAVPGSVRYRIMGDAARIQYYRRGPIL